MQKRAHMMYRNPCTLCEEAKSFLEQNGVIVKVRDLTQDPLRKSELQHMLGYHDPKYFLDYGSPTFAKKKLDEHMPSREELFGLIEESPELLRHPIVMCGRLMTIGFNRRQMVEMFQLSVSNNGSGNEDETKGSSEGRNNRS
jgi:arsenate reductase-like glutaredoxin family protein